MKILVTGAIGFIGSHLSELLIKNGHTVKALVRKSSNLQWLKDLPIEFCEGSYFDLNSLSEITKDVDYIYHVAGLVAAKNYDEFLKANRDSTENLLKAAYDSNPNLKKFIFVSSQTAAGPSKSKDEPVTENDIPNPITSYGKSKKEAEDVAKSYMDKLPITIVRPPAVYGPRDPAIKDIFKIAKSGFGVLIGFNNKYVSLIHSSDLVRGIELAGTSDISSGETYFITSNQFYSWSEVMDVMKSVFNKKFFLKIRLPHFIVLSLAGISDFFGRFSDKPPVFDYEKGIDFVQDYWTCSPEKAKRDLHFTSEIDLEKGIRETAEWYIKQKWI